MFLKIGCRQGGLQINEAKQQIEWSRSVVWPRLRSLSRCCVQATRLMRLEMEATPPGRRKRAARAAEQKQAFKIGGRVVVTLSNKTSRDTARGGGAHKNVWSARTFENLPQHSQTAIALVVANGRTTSNWVVIICSGRAPVVSQSQAWRRPADGAIESTG